MEKKCDHCGNKAVGRSGRQRILHLGECPMRERTVEEMKLVYKTYNKLCRKSIKLFPNHGKELWMTNNEAGSVCTTQ